MDKIDYIIKKYIDKINNEKQIAMYYEIGSFIKQNKLNVKNIDLFLKDKYGIVIAFTDRNLNNMVKFSRYDKKQLEKLKKITWKNILLIMKNSDELIDICLEYKPTKQQLEEYINHHKKLKKNDIIELDDTLEELMNLRK